MKVCIPIYDERRFQLYQDINNAPNIIIFDTDTNEYIVKDTSKNTLGEIIQFLIDKNISRVISNVKNDNHHKYMSCKDIVIYKPNLNGNAFFNMELFMVNELKIDKREH